MCTLLRNDRRRTVGRKAGQTSRVQGQHERREGRQACRQQRRWPRQAQPQPRRKRWRTRPRQATQSQPQQAGRWQLWELPEEERSRQSLQGEGPPREIRQPWGYSAVQKFQLRDLQEAWQTRCQPRRQGGVQIQPFVLELPTPRLQRSLPMLQRWWRRRKRQRRRRRRPLGTARPRGGPAAESRHIRQVRNWRSGTIGRIWGPTALADGTRSSRRR